MAHPGFSPGTHIESITFSFIPQDIVVVNRRFLYFGFQGRRDLAEGALTSSPVPFLPNLLRPNLLRPKYNSIIVQKCGAAKVKIFHLDTAPVYQITFAVSS